MGTDGNCFFRAVADQLYGYEFYHSKSRKEVVAHLEANKDEYKFYIDGDMAIDDYIDTIGQDGAWGG